MIENKKEFKLISKKTSKSLLPNALTIFGLCLGLSSIKFALDENYTMSIIAIGFAAILDTLDGRVARLIKGTSKVGKELHSLTDVISFGVAPGFIMYFWSLNEFGKTKFIATRFGNVLGSNGSVVPLFRKQIENGGPITVTHEEITRYFMTIPEACNLVLEAGAMGQGGEVFVFDMGEPVKILDMAKKMVNLSGMELNKDISIEITGLRPGEKLYEELLASSENTLPTHHPKIMVAKVETYSIKAIKKHLDILTEIMIDGDVVGMVRKIKAIVPEYISQNSEFEALD